MRSRAELAMAAPSPQLPSFRETKDLVDRFPQNVIYGNAQLCTRTAASLVREQQESRILTRGSRKPLVVTDSDDRRNWLKCFLTQYVYRLIRKEKTIKHWSERLGFLK